MEVKIFFPVLGRFTNRLLPVQINLLNSKWPSDVTVMSYRVKFRFSQREVIYEVTRGQSRSNNRIMVSIEEKIFPGGASKT